MVGGRLHDVDCAAWDHVRWPKKACASAGEAHVLRREIVNRSVGEAAWARKEGVWEAWVRVGGGRHGSERAAQVGGANHALAMRSQPVCGTRRHMAARGGALTASMPRIPLAIAPDDIR
jgi:hypothetical protein